MVLGPWKEWKSPFVIEIEERLFEVTRCHATMTDMMIHSETVRIPFKHHHGQRFIAIQ